MKTDSSKFSVSIKNYDGLVTNNECDTVYEGLVKFVPPNIKGRVTVSVSKNDKKYDKVLFAPLARRTFYNMLALKIFARNIERSLL